MTRLKVISALEELDDNSPSVDFDAKTKFVLAKDVQSPDFSFSAGTEITEVDGWVKAGGVNISYDYCLLELLENGWAKRVPR